MKQGISLPQIPKKLLDTDKDLYDYLFGLQQALLSKQTDDYSAVDKASTDITTLAGSVTSFIADNKATEAEAVAGTSDAKIITPLSMRQGFNVSGDAPVYACRAWVDFNGTTDGTWPGGTSTVYRAAGSTTATVTTTTAHGLITGNRVYAASGVAAGVYEATVTDATHFTITTAATTLLNNVSITFTVSTIIAQGNVSSVAHSGSGGYYINFSVPMPSENYAIVGTGAANNNAGAGWFTLGSTYGNAYRNNACFYIGFFYAYNGTENALRANVSVFC